MPFSYAQYTGNGSTTTFSVPFPYLLRAHVKLYYGLNLVSGGYDTLLVDGSNYSWTSATQVQITPAPPNGTVLTIRRETPTTSRLVDWSDGSNLNAADLDTADLQNFYAIQEHRDYIDALTITPSANVTDGSITANKLSTDAVTTAKIADDAISTAKIADDAISTAKIADDAISNAKIADNAISNAKIDDEAVTDAKVDSNAAIAGTKIAPNFGSQNIVTSGTANLAGLAYPTADGTADQSLVTNGSGTLSFASRSRLVRGTAVASTSGVSISFTSLPSWVRKLTIILSGVSTNGTANILLRLSTGGVFATTAYVSNMQVVQGGSSTNAADSTAGFIISQGAASVVTTGTYEFINNDGNEWVGRSVVAYEHAVVGAFGGGRLTLGGTLDGIRILTANGTDTFDAGTVNIIYEG